MRKYIRKIFVTVFIVLLVPLFVRQDGCGFSDNYKRDVLKRIEGETETEGEIEIGVLFVPLLNSKTGIDDRMIGDLNYYFASKLKELVEFYNRQEVEFYFKSKEKGWRTRMKFQVYEDLKDVSKLVDLIFENNRNVSQDEFIGRIKAGMPANVNDIIIAGRCYEDISGDLVSIEIKVAFPFDRKITSQKILRPKSELLCLLPQFKAIQLSRVDDLAKKFLRNDIDCAKIDSGQTARELIQSIWSPPKPGQKKNNQQSFADLRIQTKPINKITGQSAKPNKVQSQEKVAQKILILPFVDSESRSSLPNKRLVDAFDKAVSKGINKILKEKDHLSIIQEGYKKSKRTKIAKQFARIVFKPNWTNKEKIHQITQKIADAEGADIVISGIYIDLMNNPSVTIRPSIFSKRKGHLRFKNLQFSREELNLRLNKKTSLKNNQTFSAAITQAVVELLKQE